MIEAHFGIEAPILIIHVRGDKASLLKGLKHHLILEVVLIVFPTRRGGFLRFVGVVQPPPVLTAIGVGLPAVDLLQLGLRAKAAREKAGAEGRASADVVDGIDVGLLRLARVVALAELRGANMPGLHLFLGYGMAHKPADVLLGKIHKIVDLSRRNAEAVVVQEGNLRRGGDAERPAAAVGTLVLDRGHEILTLKIPQVKLVGQLFGLCDQCLFNFFGLGAEVDDGQCGLDHLVGHLNLLVGSLGKSADTAESGQRHHQAQQHSNHFLHGYFFLLYNNRPV